MSNHRHVLGLWALACFNNNIKKRALARSCHSRVWGSKRWSRLRTKHLISSKENYRLKNSFLRARNKSFSFIKVNNHSRLRGWTATRVGNWFLICSLWSIWANESLPNSKRWSNAVTSHFSSLRREATNKTNRFIQMRLWFASFRSKSLSSVAWLRRWQNCDRSSNRPQLTVVMRTIDKRKLRSRDLRIRSVSPKMSSTTPQTNSLFTSANSKRRLKKRKKSDRESRK